MRRPRRVREGQAYWRWPSSPQEKQRRPPGRCCYVVVAGTIAVSVLLEVVSGVGVVVEAAVVRFCREVPQGWEPARDWFSIVMACWWASDMDCGRNRFRVNCICWRSPPIKRMTCCSSESRTSSLLIILKNSVAYSSTVRLPCRRFCNFWNINWS